MARAAPTPGQKLSFIFFIILSSFILYIDITSNNFQSIKNGFKSFKISSFYMAKEISIEPLKSIVNLSKSKSQLVKENNDLREALELSYLNNYLISKENIFLKTKKLLKKHIMRITINLNMILHILKALIRICINVAINTECS
ncbi:hypothetical protein OAZ16_04175 [Gammaproteobacteria bacterium]|nr:hypothetical protein [Gammaproteobacteria bacterium]